MGDTEADQKIGLSVGRVPEYQEIGWCVGLIRWYPDDLLPDSLIN